jgi:hypothetical protein
MSTKAKLKQRFHFTNLCHQNYIHFQVFSHAGNTLSHMLWFLQKDKKATSIWIAAFCIFFTSYMWATNLRVADFLFQSDLYNWWSNFQKDSDSFIIARLNSNINEGLISHFGALGPDGSYIGQIGLGGWLLSLIPSLLPISQSQAIWLMYLMTAGINSIIVTTLAIFIWRQLGKYPAIAFSLCLIQPWPTAIFQSIYWSIWIKLLPLVFVFLWQSNPSRKSSKRNYFSLFALGIFAFSSGYEFITLVYSGVLGVLVFFSILSNNSLKCSSLKTAKIISVLTLSFVSTLLLHFLQLLHNLRSVSQAFQGIVLTIAKRTGFTDLEVDPIYLESLTIHPLNVLEIYLNMPVFLSPSTSIITRTLSVQAFLVMVFVGCCLHVLNRQHSYSDSNFDSLFAFWMIGFLGPVGWYLLAKPHSYIHQHINFALWYIFTIPLGMALIVHLFAKPRRQNLNVQKFSVILVFIVLMIFLFFAYASLSVR